jgi:exodeoxyribonuclease VII small subunit
MSSPLKTEISFEKAMDRLEEIVVQMEGDRMPLDQMVASYEEGMGLLKVCRHLDCF